MILWSRIDLRTLFALLIGLGCASLSSAQSFTTLYGGPAAEHGVGVIMNDTAFLVASRTYASGKYRGRLDQRDMDGTPLVMTDLDIAGVLFLQSMAPIVGGGAFVVGSHIPSGDHEHDGLVARVGSDNSLSWITHLDIDGDQQYYGAVPVEDGGVIVCGTHKSTNNKDVLVARFDLSGTLLWSHTFDGGLDDEAYAIAGDATGVVLTGRQLNFGGTSDALFMRYALDGTLEWNTAWGGIGNEVGRALVRRMDGTFIMAGTTDSYGTFDVTDQHIKRHVYLHAFNATGDTLWTKAIGDTIFHRNTFCMDQASNGDLLIGGERWALSGESDAMVLRLTTQGTLIWERGIDVGKEERISGIQALSDGMVATGWSFSNLGRRLLLIRRDQQGN